MLQKILHKGDREAVLERGRGGEAYGEHCFLIKKEKKWLLQGEK